MGMTPQKVTESRGDCFQTEKIDFSVEKCVFLMFLTTDSESWAKNRYFEKKIWPFWLRYGRFWKFWGKIWWNFQNRPNLSQNGQMFFSKYLFFLKIPNLWSKTSKIHIFRLKNLFFRFENSPPVIPSLFGGSYPFFIS